MGNSLPVACRSKVPDEMSRPRLRQKIEADAGAPRYLVTASGIGYALQPTDSE